jgi:hypothetical protein
MGEKRLRQANGFGVPARYRVVALAIWPGLAQIWSGQEVLGLLFGLCFAAALDLAIVTRWIWRELFAPGWTDFFSDSGVSLVGGQPDLHFLVDRIVPSRPASPGDRPALP